MTGLHRLPQATGQMNCWYVRAGQSSLCPRVLRLPLGVPPAPARPHSRGCPSCQRKYTNLPASGTLGPEDWLRVSVAGIRRLALNRRRLALNQRRLTLNRRRLTLNRRRLTLNRRRSVKQ